MLHTVLLSAQVIISILLVALILLQRGKGAEAGAAFGAGASGTVFGSKGSASFLSRTTAVLATLFILTSLALANIVGTQRPPQSLMESSLVEQPGSETPTALPPPAADAEVPDLPLLPPQTAPDGVPADAADDGGAEGDTGP